MCQGEGLLPVLRLLLLYCAVHGGVPKRRYDALRCVARAARGQRLCGRGGLPPSRPPLPPVSPGSPPRPLPRRDLLNTYGHQHLLTLTSLAKAGLLQRREGRRSAFPAAKQQLRLLLQEGEAIDERDPQVCG